MRERVELGPRVARFDAQQDDDRDQQFLYVRWLSMAAFSVAIVLLPVTTPLSLRVGTALVLTFLLAPMGLLVEKRSKIGVDLIHATVDHAATIAISIAIPPVRFAAMIVAACLTISNVQAQPRWVSRTAGIVHPLAFGWLLYDNGTELWWAPPLALFFMVPTIASYFDMQHRATMRLRDRYDTLIDAAQVFFWEIDVETGLITTVAGNSEALTGYRPDELIGQGWTVLIPPDAADETRASFANRSGRRRCDSRRVFRRRRARRGRTPDATPGRA